MADEKDSLPPRIQLFPNRLYDWLKWVCLILLPSIGAFYFGGAMFLHWPNPTGFCGMINLITVFLGSILGISTRSYNTSDTKFDGQITVTPSSEPGESKLHVNIPVQAFQQNKDTIVLKVLK